MLKRDFLYVLTLATPALLAQAHPPETPAESDFTLHVASELVVLNVGVQDSHGKNIRGLKAQDFKIYEDGHLQTLKQFSAEDQPVTVGIVVDASGSMRTKQVEVVMAALAFVDASNPDDETFVVNFNDHAYLTLPPDVPFSRFPHQIKTALLRRKPEGKTALFDALTLAANHLPKGKWENKALLVLSDGGDNGSTTTFRDALRAVAISGASVYTIALFDPDEPEHKLGVLNRLSKMSGGESFVPMELSEIRSLCLRIAADLRARYTLAYTPPQPDQHTALRKIRVVATAPHGARLTVRARANYILPER